MGKLVRFGVSLEKKLLDQFDASIRRKGYTNRSEALRDLVRADLVAGEWDKGEDVVGVIMLVFDHHHRELQNKITDLQHRHLSAIISTQHVHLDHNNCLEVIVLKGKADKVRRLTGLLQAQRGIKHCSLSMSTTGRSIA